MHARTAFSLIVALVPFTVVGSPALADCKWGQTGTALCPTFVAPATTAVPSVPMGGSVAVPTGGDALPLFNGATPRDGFMVQMNLNGGGGPCWVNDNGPAKVSPPNGFLVVGGGGFSPMFATPQGYKPIGPVSIACAGSSGGLAYFEVRGW
jgi:hypothetical protein